MIFRKTPTTQNALSIDEAKLISDRLKNGDLELCTSCRGIHARACPRVKRMVFVGTEIKEVEFWQDGQYDTSMILWPEDIQGVLLDAEEKREA